MSMKGHYNIVGVIVCSCNMIVDQCYCSQEVNLQFEKKKFLSSVLSICGMK